MEVDHMLDGLIGQFLGSSEGANTVKELAAEHGLSEDDARNAVQATAEGAAEATSGGGALGALGGLLGGSTGGIEETVARIVADKTGLSPDMAQKVVAFVLPKVMGYLKGGGEEQGGPGLLGGLLGG